MRAPLAALVLLLGIFLPAVEAQGNGSGADEFHPRDKEGDVTFIGPGLPSSAATDAVDLVGLRIYDETVEGFHLAIEVKNLRRTPTMAIFGQTYYVNFRASTTPPAQYVLSFFPDSAGLASLQNETPSFRTSFCAGVAGNGCVQQRVLGATDYTKNSLDAYISKAALSGLDPIGSQAREPPVPLLLTTGSRLVNFTVSASTFIFRDQLPDSGYAGPYLLRTPSANQRVRVQLHHAEASAEVQGGANGSAPPPPTVQTTDLSGDFPHVAIEPGVTLAVPLDVRNLNGGKRILNLTTAFENPKDAAQWQLRVAPSVTVPANDTRTINLLVNASGRLQTRDDALIHVRARSLGFDDEIGSITLRLVANVPLGPDHHKVYLHAAQLNAFPGPCATGPFFATCGYRTWINTAEQDPTANADDATMSSQGLSFNPSGNGGSSTAIFRTEEPLSRTLVLDAAKPITGTLKVGNVPAGGATVRVEVTAGPLFVGGTEVPLAAGSRDATFSFLPLLEAQRIPTDSVLQVRAVVSFQYLGPGAASLVTPPGIVPKGSFLDLPLIPDPRAAAAPPRLGASYLSFAVRGDPEDFVNPGEARAFNLTLLNEGVDADTILVNGSVTQGKCGLEVRPGQRFRLDSGDSARLGVLLHARDDAKEGDKCVARLLATSESSPDVQASIEVRVVVTNGIDLRDDAGNYTEDADSAAKIDDGGAQGRSPGLAPVLLLATLALAAGWIRRRPGRA